LWVIFILLDPDPDPESGYGPTNLIESGPGSETLLAACHKGYACVGLVNGTAHYDNERE